MIRGRWRSLATRGARPLPRRPAGLVFAGGTTAGQNLAKVIINYHERQRARAVGERAVGRLVRLDRPSGHAEGAGQGHVHHRGNAQLKQIQSGSAVDRSPTAAVR